MVKKYFFLFVSIIAISCQPDNGTADDLKIATNIYVRFLQNESSLKAEASFKEERPSAKKATPKEFSEGVKFDGHFMKLRNIKDQLLRYQMTRRENFTGNYAFEIIDKDIKNFKIPVEMMDIKSFATDSILTRNKGLLLQWEGNPLDENEEIILMFSDSKNKAYSNRIKGPTIKSQYQFKPEELPEIPPGNGKLYLVRKKHHKQSVNNFEVSANLEFYTDNKDILIGE